MSSRQISETEMREALGLAPGAPKEKPKRPGFYTQVVLSVRKRTGGPAFTFEYRSRSVSTLAAQLEAEKAVREQGLEVWAVLDIRQIAE